MPIPRESDFTTEVRADVKKLWEAVNGLVAKQREWTALDYGNTLAAGTGLNDGITRGKISDALFTSTNAIVAVLNAGHGTNLAKLL